MKIKARVLEMPGHRTSSKVICRQCQVSPGDSLHVLHENWRAMQGS